MSETDAESAFLALARDLAAEIHAGHALEAELAPDPPARQQQPPPVPATYCHTLGHYYGPGALVHTLADYYGHSAGQHRAGNAQGGIESGADPAREPSGGQPAPGGQGAAWAPPESDVRQEGGDVVMGQLPGQQWQQPARGVQPRRRRLRYSARQAIRRPAQQNAADSGFGPAGEGASGGASET